MPPKPNPPTHDSAVTMALQALAFILSEESLRQRFVDLSGVSADDLRHGLGEDSVLAAILGFLAGHEPDLMACAAALDVTPQQLMHSARLLQGAHDQ
jgi:hypothetical protein